MRPTFLSDFIVALGFVYKFVNTAHCRQILDRRSLDSTTSSKPNMSLFIYNSSFIGIDGNRYFCLFDDAMISMRFAWNFSHGYGLVWNPGEYIQGYTNLLMVLIMSFVNLVFDDKSTAVLFIQILGMAFMLSIAYITMKIADYITKDEKYQNQVLIRVISLFLTLFYYPLAYWSLMGMETGLLSLLLLLGIFFAFTYIEKRALKSLFFTAVFLGLAFLTRNESIIFAFLIGSYVIGEVFKMRAVLKILWLLLAATGLYIIFVIGQLAFQYLYYGELLPNTYTLKLTGMPLFERIKNGVGFVKPYLSVTTFILLLPIIDLVFDFREKKLLLISIMFSSIGYQVYVGGDPWNYWRIMAPVMPLIFILFISAINAIVLAISQPFNAYFLRNPIFPRKFTSEALVIMLALIGLLLVNARFLPEALFLIKPYTVESNKINVNTAIALNELTTSDSSVGVYWAGSIPYFTNRKAIDFLGKSDRYIAKLPPDLSGKISWNGMKSVPGHNKYDLKYSIKDLEPTYVQGFKWGVQDLSEFAEKRYANIEYAGVSLFLLKESPTVLWNKVIN